MLLEHWPQKRREWVLGGFINILFVLFIVGIRYYYAQEELEFLRNDSERQDNLIVELTDTVNTLTEQNTNLLHDLHEHDKTRGNENYLLKKKLELLESEIDSIKILINELPTQTQEVKVGDASGVIPFEKEFGVQGNYLRIFGRTGYLIKDGKLADSETDIGLDGSLQMGLPYIEQGEVKGEYYAVVPDTLFNGVRISGRRGNPLKLKPPRNQISVGPFAGVIYDSKTGLTEPVFGFGVSYNMLKVWDWR
jgi:hypothetical protein|tara:strand:- start:1388 stop:2137 length:750 start_codon:yes stop_codon:yes gene_type:complete